MREPITGKNCRREREGWRWMRVSGRGEELNARVRLYVDRDLVSAGVGRLRA